MKNTDIAEQLSSALQESIDKKNTFTVSEFKKFKPLFLQSALDNPMEYSELSGEWASRVSLYHPVTIVNPTTKEVVLKLSPMFTKVDTMNTAEGSDAVVNRFAHALGIDHPLRNDKEAAMSSMCNMLEQAQDRARVDNDIKTFADIAEAAGFAPATKKEEAATTEDMMGKLEWS